jgi:hypothetical protein
MLRPGTIEIRFHKAFSDADVVCVVRALSAEPDLGLIRQWRITYQGRLLTI